jgi:peptidoglycan/xylan/chitin deacetylase (PgdA/CDA1 family)
MIVDCQVNKCAPKRSLFHDLERTIASPGNRNQSARIMANTYVNHWRDAIERPQGVMSTARLFARNRLLDLLALNRTRPVGNSLRYLFCHYVFDDQKVAFERLIKMLKSLGRFVDSQTALQMTRGERPVDGTYFHLSFDDGLKNNFINAVPVLAELEVPCTFFVPPALIDADYAAASHYCLNITRYRGVIEMANWNDLHAAVAAGFEIGSHSLSHARLSEVSSKPTQLNAEITGSKHLLEDRLGVGCRYIAWPYGTLSDIDEASFENIRSAGYEAAFGNFRIAVAPGKTDLFCIPRHHFEPQWPLAHVRYFSLGGWERMT